jgi:tRNA pseudouridine38-40 synthase
LTAPDTTRLRLDLGYDGSGFSGWARQPGRRTVQGELEAALTTLARTPVGTVAAGRTDAGVHARGQVVHADVPTPAVAAVADLRRLAGLLDPDCRVSRVGVAPAGFDARFSALWRRYSYRVADGVADPLRRLDTVTYPRSLEPELMRQAAELLLGEHDFAAFCRRREGAGTVRTLLRLDWARDADGVLVATVVADAFCHSMVRSLVGALLAVGQRQRPVDWPAALLGRQVRATDVTVAPAHGLTLMEVGYPPPEQLAARAERTRARRVLGGTV